MRNTKDIPKEEFEERLQKSIGLLNDPYRKALQKRQSEIFSNPNCNEWRTESGQPSYGMKPQFNSEWEQINEELDLYRRNLYPELLFPIEDDEKLKEIDNLKTDKEYDNLVKGLRYFADEIENDEKAVAEIKKLNKQISEFIEKKFTNLFREIPKY